MAVFDEDLDLAEACARGESTALEAFEQRFGADLDRAVAKSPTLGVSADEFRQLVREKLFVGREGRAARIAGYQGKGPLRAWVRVTATRLVVDLARKRPSEVPRTDEELARRLPPADDPELEHLRHAYGSALPDAFEEALQNLTARQRNLLRQRFLHELTVERMAAMYDVHRSTMFEWLGKARTDLFALVQSALAERIGDQQLASVVAVLGSKLDMSVRRMLDSKLEDSS
jgi:RNA polymerase sigma-70 factor (ECF subfamily)